MKRKMKFEDLKIGDLSEVLKSLCAKVDDDIADTDLAKPYFDKIDWKKATDSERLAYCEARYKEKMTVLCAYDKAKAIIESRPFTNGGIAYNHDIWCNDGNLCLYDDDKGKFAEIIEDEVKEPSIKEKLKGTCVLNESVEMGAEIVKLYTEAGFRNPFGYIGLQIGVYFGSLHNQITWRNDAEDFTKVLTIDQLRSIVRGDVCKECGDSGRGKPTLSDPDGAENDCDCVRGEKEESEYKKTLKRQLAKDFSDDLIPNRNYIYHGNERDMVKGNTYFVYKANPDYIELLDAYGNPHQFVRSEWPLFELVKAESVEFKEGEMVEFQNGNYRIIFIYKDSVWIKQDQQEFGRIVSLSSIRKIDPDADLKKIADEVMNKPSLLTENGNPCYLLPDVKSMLIEMAKRVKK